MHSKISIAHLSLLFFTLLITSCSTQKLEARLEANPQCKDVVNPKTGALMPCPGSDQSFYREAGLAPIKPTLQRSGSSSIIPIESSRDNYVDIGRLDCKPQLHKKTGGALPCPAPDKN